MEKPDDEKKKQEYTQTFTGRHYDRIVY